jgi:predicted PurR-regulated permease PerM
MNEQADRADPDTDVHPSGPEHRLTRASGRSILLGLIAVAVFLYVIRVVLLPFVLAAAAAYAVSPVVDWLMRWTGGRRWIAALLVFLAVVAVGGVLGFFVAPSAVDAVLQVASNVRDLVGRLISSFMGNGAIELFGQHLTAQQMADQLVQMASEWITQNGRVMLLASWAFSILFALVLTLVIFVYFLISGPSIERGLFKLIPPAQRGVCEEIWELTGPVLQRYFIGIFLVVVYASVAAYLGLGLFLQLPHAVLLAILTGVLEMVPVIGPAASGVIVGLAAVQAAKGAWSIILFIIYAVALRLSIDDLVGPLVLGRASSIHPVVVIFCFLAGGILFGVVGLIMAVPVALTLRVALGVLYEDPEIEALLVKQRKEEA